MSENSGNGNGQSRLDRLEGLMELLIDDHVQFQQEHRQLLAAQVVLTERVDKFALKVDKLADSLGELRESQRHTGERMNALIAVVDDTVRKRPPQP